MASPIVTTHGACTIISSAPSCPGLSYYLSNFDIVLAGSHLSNAILYFHSFSYRPDHSQHIGRLKDSLSKAISLLPIIGGRVVPDENGRLHISCKDQGIPFVEAYADASFMDWDITNSEMENLLVSQNLKVTHLDKTPILQIQVTMFKCGSWSMGVTASEYLIDGATFALFLKCWSEVHCGLPISNMPVVDAALFKARDPPCKSTLPARDYRCLELQKNNDDDHPVRSKSFTSCQFYFSSSSVEDLIREIQSGPHKYGRATPFEALTALVWKTITEARNLPDDAETKYVYPISLRNNKRRWQPVIPPTFFGNAVHMSCVPARAGDIKSNHISYAANLIHNNNLHNTGDEYMKLVIDWMEIQLGNKGNHGFDSNLDRYAGRDIYSTFWNYPVFDVRFGSGYRMAHISLPATGDVFGDGVSFMMPSPEGGKSKIVSLSLEDKVMARLGKNRLFSTYCKPAKVSFHDTEEEENVVLEKPKWATTLKFYSRI